MKKLFRNIVCKNSQPVRKVLVVLSLIYVLSISFISCNKDSSSSIHSDYFTKFFGTSGQNIGSDVKQTADGGYIIVGTTEIPHRGTDIFLIKTNKFGDEEWSKNFGDTLNDYCKSVQITPDGGYIILGTSTSKVLQADQTDMYLIKTDSRGNEQWNKKLGGSFDQEGNCVQLTSDNGYILLGTSNEENLPNQNSQGKKDILLIKTDINGTPVWNKPKLLGGADDDTGNYLQQKSDNGFIIIGNTNSFSEAGKSDQNIIVIETNENGIQTDFILDGGLYPDFGECIKILPDKSYILCGTITNTDGTASIYTKKLGISNIRNAEWSKSIETGFGSSGKSICTTSNNGFALTGTSAKNGNKDICLIKLSSDGNIDFAKYFGDVGGIESGNSIFQTSDAGFIISGSNNYDGPTMLTLLKTNSAGEQK